MIIEIILLIIFSSLFYLKFLKNAPENHGNYNNIPIVKGLPLIGSISDYFYSDVELWKVSRKRNLDNYPIYRKKTFNIEIVYLLDPEDIQLVLGGSVKTTKGVLYDTARKFLSDGLLTSEGEVWRGRRKLLTKSFHFTILQKYMNIFNKHLSSFRDNLSLGKPTEILPEAKLLTLRVINDVSLGRLVSDENLLKRFSKAVDLFTKMINFRSVFPKADFFIKFTDIGKEEEAAIGVFNEFSSTVLEEYHHHSNQKNERGFDSVTDLMVNSPKLFPGTQEVKSELITLNFAGQDTTASGLSIAMIALASHPHFQDMIHEEVIETIGKDGEPTFDNLKSMTFLDRFLKELLRMYPPAMWIGRRIEEDITTKTGYTIPAGKTVLIFIYDLHHNPRFFPNPEVFDPDRFLPDNIKEKHPFSYIPFGAGARNCIAQRFAFLELKTCICYILQKFIIKSEKHIDEISFVPDVILKPKDPIVVKFISRN